MKLLILGGTRFVGRHLVTAALARNHEITLFHRGNHPAADLKNVETVYGNRNIDLRKLSDRRWDAVVDTCGHLPHEVRASAEFLSNSVDRYVFISSQSAYADVSRLGLDENAPLANLTNEQLDEAQRIAASAQSSDANYGKLYGGLKALCEHAEEIMPNRAVIVRPRLIVGPDDYTDRFTYWVARVAEGGEVLAPGRRDRCLQFIDARDLAEWTIGMIEKHAIGIYNATGSPNAFTMGSVLDECKKVSGSDAVFSWVDEEFLLQEQVTAWSEMPLWLPEQAAPYLKGFMFINCDKAVAAGLRHRPLNETIRDTLTWYRANRLNERLLAGIEPEKERAVLRKWKDLSDKRSHTQRGSLANPS
jgi:nucleoside-diphosphate-sugar epimerase